MFVIDDAVLEIEVPEELVASRSREESDGAQVVLVLFLGLLRGIASSDPLLGSLLGGLLFNLRLITRSSFLCGLIGLSCVTVLFGLTVFSFLGGFSLFLLLFFCCLLFLKTLFFGLLAFEITKEVANTNLAFVISTKAVDASGFPQDDRVVLAADNLDHVVLHVWVQVLNFLGDGDRLLVTQTQLTVVVHAPRVDLASVVQVERVIAAAKDVFGVLGASFLNLERLLLLQSGLNFASKFS